LRDESHCDFERVFLLPLYERLTRRENDRRSFEFPLGLWELTVKEFKRLDQPLGDEAGLAVP
jgi:hypothetical protein